MKNLIITLISVLALFGCADTVIIDSCINDEPYGFWSGLWYGFVSPISFIGSLFSDSIAMYAKNNSGGWYDFGFCIGAGILFRSSNKIKK